MSALIFLILILAVVQDIESYSNHRRYNGSTSTALARFTENKKFERALPLFTDNSEYERQGNGNICAAQGGLCSEGRRCCKLLTCRTEGHFKDRCGKTDCIGYLRLCKDEGDCCSKMKCITEADGYGTCMNDRRCQEFRYPCNTTIECCSGLHCLKSATTSKCNLLPYKSGTITLSLWPCIAVLVSSWTFKFVLV